MSTILQLCGRAPVSAQPPDLGCERWIVGASYDEHIGTAYTRVFDVHDPDWIRHRRPAALAWYASQDRPVYLREPMPEVPNAVIYPRQRVNGFAGDRGACAISSTIDQMMALAFCEGFTEIHLCGVRLITTEEWLTQRECLAYWIGRCEGVGIRVVTDPVSALCSPGVLYGFNEPTGARRAPGQPVLVLGGA